MNLNNNDELVSAGSNDPVEKKSHPVNQITPLSKYLALALFILLPFIGGYVGYQLAPEEVIETSIQNMMEPSIDIPVKADLQVSATNSPQVSTTYESESITPHECTSAENPYVHLCFSFTPTDSSQPIIKNLNETARSQGFVNDRRALQSLIYISSDNNKIYFTVGIPESDACCSLVTFDTETKKFTEVKSFKGSINSVFSFDKRFIATIENDSTLYVLDLETEKIINRQVLETGSLVSTSCGMTGVGYDVVFNAEKKGFDYGIYGETVDKKDSCKFEKINTGFISTE